jgi:hypothetical protein
MSRSHKSQVKHSCNIPFLSSFQFMQKAKAREDVKKKEDEVPVDDSHWVAPAREGDGGAEW